MRTVPVSPPRLPFADLFSGSLSPIEKAPTAPAKPCRYCGKGKLNCTVEGTEFERFRRWLPQRFSAPRVRRSHDQAHEAEE